MGPQKVYFSYDDSGISSASPFLQYSELNDVFDSWIDWLHIDLHLLCDSRHGPNLSAKTSGNGLRTNGWIFHWNGRDRSHSTRDSSRHLGHSCSAENNYCLASPCIRSYSVGEVSSYAFI